MILLSYFCMLNLDRYKLVPLLLAQCWMPTTLLGVVDGGLLNEPIVCGTSRSGVRQNRHQARMLKFVQVLLIVFHKGRQWK